MYSGARPNAAGGLDRDADLIRLVGVCHGHRVGAKRRSARQQLAGGGGPEGGRKRDHDPLRLDLAEQAGELADAAAVDRGRGAACRPRPALGARAAQRAQRRGELTGVG